MADLAALSRWTVTTVAWLFLLLLAGIAAIAALALWIGAEPLPRSDDFPEALVQAIHTPGDHLISDLAPDAAQVCLISEYLSANDFGKRIGVPIRTRQHVPENTVMVLLRMTDGRESYATFSRSRIEYEEGCREAAGAVLRITALQRTSTTDPQPFAAHPPAGQASAPSLVIRVLPPR